MRFLGRREISPTRGLHSAHHGFLGWFHVVPCFAKRSLWTTMAQVTNCCRPAAELTSPFRKNEKEDEVDETEQLQRETSGDLGLNAKALAD
jgi:hypothetical protein